MSHCFLSLKEVQSTCAYCGAGCQILFKVDEAKNKIVEAVPAMGRTNAGTLCLKGHYGWDYLNDPSVVECAILTIYEAGGHDYIALLPLTDEGEADGSEVYLYRYTVTDDGPMLENIENDEEYEIAADRFDEMLDELEYEENLGIE